jgi:hypothetical protein
LIDRPAARVALETYDCEAADPAALNRHAPKSKRTGMAEPAPARRHSRQGDNAASHQLSLGELMALVTFVCTMCAGFCWLSRGGFAGLAGTATVLSLRVVDSDETPLVMRLGWWTLLGTYLAAAAMAVWDL